jgi:hypothetical protein
VVAVWSGPPLQTSPYLSSRYVKWTSGKDALWGMPAFDICDGCGKKVQFSSRDLSYTDAPTKAVT